LHLVSIAKTPRPVAMRRAPHLEAQLQAMKAALDGKANSRRPLTATWDEYQPTVIVEVPETYRSYKNRVLRSLPQECDPNRFADGDWKGLVRDPEDKSELLGICGEDKAEGETYDFFWRHGDFCLEKSVCCPVKSDKHSRRLWSAIQESSYMVLAGSSRWV